MDLAIWLDATTTIATVLAVALAVWAIRIAERAVELQRKVALQDVTVNVRQALSSLTSATGEFNAQLMPYWKKPVTSSTEEETTGRLDEVDQWWINHEINIHSQVHRIKALGRALNSELDALFAFAPQAWIETESTELKAWIDSFCAGAWFAPYSALVSEEDNAGSARAMASYLPEHPSDSLRAMAVDRLYDSNPSLPRKDAAKVAIAFFEAAERHLADAVTRAADRGARLVADAAPLHQIDPEPWLDDVLPSPVPPRGDTSDRPSAAVYAFQQSDGSRREGTLRELMCYVVPDYADVVFDERVALARRQQAALHHLTVNQESTLTRLGEEHSIVPSMREVMLQSKAKPAVDPSTNEPLASWDELHPLFLLTSHYIPHSELARPSGSRIVWVDPTTEESMLESFGALRLLKRSTTH